MHGRLLDIQNLGGSLVAISPEKPDNTLNMIEKLELPFPVLSDFQGEVMKSYKVSWELPKILKENYLKHLKMDFSVINQGSGWILPIPATFIIDRNGEIRYKYVNPDLTKRLEPTRIIEVLKTLQ